jgi:hypothetical protein
MGSSDTLDEIKKDLPRMFQLEEVENKMETRHFWEKKGGPLSGTQLDACATRPEMEKEELLPLLLCLKTKGGGSYSCPTPFRKVGRETSLERVQYKTTDQAKITSLFRPTTILYSCFQTK